MKIALLPWDAWVRNPNEAFKRTLGYSTGMFKWSQHFSFLKRALKMYIHLLKCFSVYVGNTRWTSEPLVKPTETGMYKHMEVVGKKAGEGSQEKLECAVMNIFSWDFYEVRHSVVHEWEVGGKVCRFLFFFLYMLKMSKRAACLLVQSSKANTVSSTL